eukprot:CAMPEP_0196728918 /NCGR_PEP_ID=MMETSP1091-20130531/9453_1 /TAXON_ID=302021 /ORGANISM="Rhodomonas sp., Strain CCMP768" /LENGTH=182 /DNA_ID=CAMNT_0042071723 /DNA_START=14 /DNA_END=562 /DNA_ORIENTATION=+
MREEDLACAACNVKNKIMKRCTRCKLVYYCQRECQLSHWKVHKVQCDIICSDMKREHESQPVQDVTLAEPLHSGIRVTPDGGYEAYAGGMKLGKDGFPVQKPRGPMAEGSRVVLCVSCGGKGRTSEVCQGIVREDYCQHCEGEGALMVGADGKKLQEEGGGEPLARAQLQSSVVDSNGVALD